jgi:hypothetical protein
MTPETATIVTRATTYLRDQLAQRGMSATTYSVFVASRRYREALATFEAVAAQGTIAETRQAGKAFVASLLDTPPASSYVAELFPQPRPKDQRDGQTTRGHRARR